ncbi:MAG: CheR family methyltransferase [Desulfovibrionales bacterium]
MHESDIEDLEISLLLEAIYLRYGHDFRQYARASVRRRVRRVLQQTSVASVSELISRIVHDESFFEDILGEFSITVTEMFRDPGYYRSLRANVIPYLKTYPFVRIWHAGCATGEEVYSTAIILEEEGFYDRVTLFATDFNAMALQAAAEGIYPLDKMRTFTENYQAAGGKRSFADHYQALRDAAIVNASLKRNITFADHNLVTDGVFSEMHFISCRNVLIYFNRELQNRVLDLFCESLVHGGMLALGSKESIRFTSVEHKFEAVDEKWKIYRKAAP